MSFAEFINTSNVVCAVIINKNKNPEIQNDDTLKIEQIFGGMKGGMKQEY